ncbi:uncharacterized protein [Coffea arabica]|uniref:Integrase catalytic domain-containing protein n=1 Tax=Coffea arabica TaxID=13443 RepID=A0A6P6W2P0_COFAR|nr:uncharacterized protein LOC113728634 [Coffea arabica]
MSPPRSIREVQRLTGRLAALNRFLSQSVSKALPFFKVLKKADSFSWTEECQQVFEQLKEYLHQLPTLTSPRPGDKLILYLSAAVETVSAVLPLRQVLSCSEASGRLTKWAIELGEYDLSYEPRTAIKAQALANFLVELTFDEVNNSTPATAETQRWILHVDGSSNSEGSGTGLLLEDPQGDVCSYALRFDFAASNNEAEYEVEIAGLQLARKLGAAHILVYSDFQLVVCQILGEYEAREEVMHRYLSKVHQLIAHFESFEIQRIPRSQNKRADALSRLVSTSFSDLNKTVLVEVLAEPEYLGEVVYPVYPGDTWMGPLIRFLSRGELPDDRTESRKLQRKAARYTIRQNLLYKRSYLGPWLRCITPEEDQRILQDIHKGLCGAHVGYRMLVKKALLLGYFWPTIRVDAQIMVLSCPACQHHAPEHHQPTNLMIPITSPWPFEQWGTDIIGQFPRAPDNYAYVVVAVDYFTKWAEAEPLRTITGTTPRSATQETPFSLTYGSEAVVPAEFITPNPRMAAYAAEINEEERRVDLDLDLAEEKRDMTAAKIALYKNILVGYYNTRVRHLRFNPGDLVLRKNSVSRAEPQGKLSPKWEGPYRVIESSQNGYCKLAYRDSSRVSRTWHAENLRMYHP